MIIAVALLALGALQIYRANRPRTVTNEPPPILQTTGTIVDDVINIPAGGFVPYRMNFTHRVRVVGKFRAVDRRQTFACLLLTADNFEKWKQRSDYRSVAETGYLPGGKMNHVLEAGTYYLVFDNRNSTEKEIPIAATFSVQ